jgi:UDP-N-acetylmuramate dehydrogenase
MHPDLLEIPGLQVKPDISLSEYTRFGVGGTARLLADANTEGALASSVKIFRESGQPFAVIGGGTNLIASDDGFPGAVLRYTAREIAVDGTTVCVQAGALLQDLVDASIDRGLRGLETMTRIPGWVGGAIYGNAGAYGHSIHERVESVRFFDGAAFREIRNAECRFAYRESVFKKNKNWIVLSATLRLEPADPVELRRTAEEIRVIRDAKYPPTMRCAGSIFKNLLLADLPASVKKQIPDHVIREGKVPSAYFLELAGAKGMVNGGIRVADYHANLIYNEGHGTAAQVRELIAELKRRVQQQCGVELEEEVQYL